MRLNARCKNCGSLERHRLLHLFFQNELGSFTDKASNYKILHFAPEKFFYNYFSSIKGINYKPCDLTPNKYKWKGPVNVSKVDITNIPFESGHFDFILCNHVLEHVPDDALAMKELHRVLNKKGFAIIQVPIHPTLENTYEDRRITKPSERKIAFGQKDHVRWYGKDFKWRLEHVGFQVDVIDYSSQFTPEEKYKYGLLASESIYLCKKSS